MLWSRWAAGVLLTPSPAHLSRWISMFSNCSLHFFCFCFCFLFPRLICTLAGTFEDIYDCPQALSGRYH